MITYSQHLATFGDDELNIDLGIETLETLLQAIDQYNDINELQNGFQICSSEIEIDSDDWPYINIMDFCWVKSYDDRKLWFRFVDETGRPRRNEFTVDLEFIIHYIKSQIKPKQTPKNLVVVSN